MRLFVIFNVFFLCSFGGYSFDGHVEQQRPRAYTTSDGCLSPAVKKSHTRLNRFKSKLQAYQKKPTKKTLKAAQNALKACQKKVSKKQFKKLTGQLNGAQRTVLVKRYMLKLAAYKKKPTKKTLKATQNALKACQKKVSKKQFKKLTGQLNGAQRTVLVKRYMLKLAAYKKKPTKKTLKATQNALKACQKKVSKKQFKKLTGQLNGAQRTMLVKRYMLKLAAYKKKPTKKTLKAAQNALKACQKKVSKKQFKKLTGQLNGAQRTVLVKRYMLKLAAYKKQPTKKTLKAAQNTLKACQKKVSKKQFKKLKALLKKAQKEAGRSTNVTPDNKPTEGGTSNKKPTVEMTPPVPGAKGPVRRVVVYIHGYTASGKEHLNVIKSMASQVPDTVFLTPNAPHKYPGRADSYQWFPLAHGFNYTAAYAPLVKNAIIPLNDYLDRVLKKYNITEDQLILAGFSQGAIMAVSTALSRSKPCRAVLAYGGAFMDAPDFQIRSKPRVLLVHGDQDITVPYAFMQHTKSALDRQGIPTETHTCTGVGHVISEEGIKKGIEFSLKN